MFSHWLSASLLFLTCSLAAQTIPPGTTLPIMLTSTLNVKKDKPGQVIKGKLMQSVSLSDGAQLRAGTTILGEVVSVSQPGSGSSLAVSFDRVKFQGTTIHFTANVRALASMMSVLDAQLPTNNFDEYGTTTADWTTYQVGGEAVYRGNSTLVSPDGEVVGKANIAGDVWAKLRNASAEGCRDDVSGNDKVQSLWVFSSTACGAYGFSDITIAHSGRTEPRGQIVLTSNRNIKVPAGSGLLLRVD